MLVRVTYPETGPTISHEAGATSGKEQEAAAQGTDKRKESHPGAHKSIPPGQGGQITAFPSFSGHEFHQLELA